jgi:hypothetical protein
MGLPATGVDPSQPNAEQGNTALMARLKMPDYPARIERAMVITIEGYDWNCPQHITPRCTKDEIKEGFAPLREEIRRLSKALAAFNPTLLSQRLGNRPLALRVDGIRQLTPRVRSYELRSADGTELPPEAAGSNIDVPVRFRSGVAGTRRYSIASSPSRHDIYEIAVLREEQGSGGSVAVHADGQLGMTLCGGLPGNDLLSTQGAERRTVLAFLGFS